MWPDPHPARREAEHCVVNGSKTDTTNWRAARTSWSPAVKTTRTPATRGLSFLMSTKAARRASPVTKKLEKLGWRASDTAELAFEDVPGARPRTCWAWRAWST